MSKEIALWAALWVEVVVGKNRVIHFEVRMEHRCGRIVGQEENFGKLQTLDRDEIDSLRSIRQIMLMYRTAGSRNQPLCLAVYGAPRTRGRLYLFSEDCEFSAGLDSVGINRREVVNERVIQEKE